MQKFLLLFFILTFYSSFAQKLKPGFDKQEYLEMLKLTSRHYHDKLPKPEHFNFVYRSPVLGLDNCWDLWTSKDSVAVISIRGTTANTISWICNFYAAMVPAKGSVKLNETETFQYELASHPHAAVHVGWLVSTAFLANDILPRIDSVYKKGFRNIIVMGHSQGGAIAYLMTAHLYNLQKKNQLPSDIRFKTYCSAGPKPGNLYFAYEYETMTQQGWAYNVVNSADWVPETPMSIQTLNDFNPTNPFINANELIRKQPFPKNIAMRHMFNKLDKPTRKAQRKYQRYLGDLTSGFVKKHIPGYTPPDYYQSNNYVRTGDMIVLLADPEYFKLFPDNKNTIFIHHFFEPYFHLAEKLK